MGARPCNSRQRYVQRSLAPDGVRFGISTPNLATLSPPKAFSNSTVWSPGLYNGSQISRKKLMRPSSPTSTKVVPRMPWPGTPVSSRCQVKPQDSCPSDKRSITKRSHIALFSRYARTPAPGPSGTLERKRSSTTASGAKAAVHLSSLSESPFGRPTSCHKRFTTSTAFPSAATASAAGVGATKVAERRAACRARRWRPSPTPALPPAVRLAAITEPAAVAVASAAAAAGLPQHLAAAGVLTPEIPCTGDATGMSGTAEPGA
mmetsp:Transcript_104072/g.333654  ORF Transcript_104072/g.333654 Transcript_104072/m.333654 type:complete len:262 (+) Transcript_104072:1354-2139(+)